MQVEVDDVKAHVARPAAAENGVGVGTVVVQQAAGIVDDLGDFQNVFFEQAERVRDSSASGPRSSVRPAFAAASTSTLPRSLERNLHDSVAAHGRAGRVGAVGRVGDDDFDPLCPSPRVFVVRLHDHEAQQLAVGARGGLQCRPAQPGDFAQILLQGVHQFQRALHRLLGLVRMHMGKAGQRGHVSFIFGLYFIVHEPSG